MSDLFDIELDSGSKCSDGHDIMLVAEGYAICTDGGRRPYWWAWALTKPAKTGLWHVDNIIGRKGDRIPAWVHTRGVDNKQMALSFIQKDIDARRAMPFDEEAERARLMPV